MKNISILSSSFIFWIHFGCTANPHDTAHVSETEDSGEETSVTTFETVGRHVQVEGPFLFEQRQYYVGFNREMYDMESVIGSLYLLHGLGASGCDFIDRYTPSRFVEQAMERGYIVILPESADQTGPCRYEIENGVFEKENHGKRTTYYTWMHFIKKASCKRIQN